MLTTWASTVLCRQTAQRIMLQEPFQLQEAPDMLYRASVLMAKRHTHLTAAAFAFA